jgi:hypothetical protein
VIVALRHIPAPHPLFGAPTPPRATTLDAAFIAHPNRFKGIAPQLRTLPGAAWINPPKKGHRSTHQHHHMLSKLLNTVVPFVRAVATHD